MISPMRRADRDGLLRRCQPDQRLVRASSGFPQLPRRPHPQLAAARRAFLAGTRPPDRCLACPQQGTPRRAERWLEGRKRGIRTRSCGRGRTTGIGSVSGHSRGRGATARTRRLRPFAVPGWNQDATRSRDLCGRARDRRVADEAVRRTGPLACRRRAHVNSSSSRFASFRSGVSKPSVNHP